MRTVQEKIYLQREQLIFRYTAYPLGLNRVINLRYHKSWIGLGLEILMILFQSSSSVMPAFCMNRDDCLSRGIQSVKTYTHVTNNNKIKSNRNRYLRTSLNMYANSFSSMIYICFLLAFWYLFLLNICYILRNNPRIILLNHRIRDTIIE